MSTIPLKNNSGTIQLHKNGTIEIKKIDATILIPKSCLNSINLYPEGRVLIYLQNSSYQYDIRVDKVYLHDINQLFTRYSSKDAECDMKLSFDIMDEYKKTLKMIGEQLISVSRFNVDISNEIELQFNATNSAAHEMQLKIHELGAANHTLRNKINDINYSMFITMILVGITLTYWSMQGLEVPSFNYTPNYTPNYTLPLLSDYLPRNNVVPLMPTDNMTMHILDPF